MSAYHISTGVTTLSQVVQEAKEKRKKVLDRVRARRKIIYTRYQKKLQSQQQKIREIQEKYTQR